MNFEMQYPLYNISVEQLGDDYHLVDEFIIYDCIYHSNDEDFFKQYFLNKRFVDCLGNVYILVSKHKINGFWIRLFHLHRYKCVFETTGEHLSVEDVCDILINQIKYSKGDFKEQIISGFRKAKTYKDLILWKTVDDI